MQAHVSIRFYSQVRVDIKDTVTVYTFVCVYVLSRLQELRDTWDICIFK